MTARIRIRILLVAVVLVAALALPAAAQAFTQAVSAPVYRSGSRVGTASGSFALTSNGWAVLNVRVLGFRAPSSGRSWRTRTTISSSCVEPGFDPAVDNPDDFASTVVNVSSPWRTTRIAGSIGTLTTTDFVEECPSGQGPGSSFLLTLTVQNSAGTTRVGAAQLFAAG
jgi:hypothetical protein